MLGNLSAKRDWGFAKEYVEAMWLMLQQDAPEDFVVATGMTHQIDEFVQLAFDYAGIDGWQDYVETSSQFIRPNEVDLLIGSPQKAKEQIGWSPKTNIQELVAMMVTADLQRYGL